MPQINSLKLDYHELTQQIKAQSCVEGFAEAYITRATLPYKDELQLKEWLEQGFYGEMEYMRRHGLMRVKPKQLMPNALSVISVKIPYFLPEELPLNINAVTQSSAYISRYALGRDYHKVLRSRLQKLANWLSLKIGKFEYRIFCDSAPIAEVALAAQAGAGWRGKNTLLINSKYGSSFFLGELVSSLPLIADTAEKTGHCGSCQRCLSVCPTQAIIAPYKLDARRCISYLTIELKSIIPEALRPLIGNRIYGCDDCQLVCPWNRFAQASNCADFAERNRLAKASLLELFSWLEADFRERMAGSAIYRIGYYKWQSNIAIALGNAPYCHEIMQALTAYINHESEILRESARWALTQQKMRYDAR